MTRLSTLASAALSLALLGTAPGMARGAESHHARTYDVLHYNLNIRVKIREESIAGTVTMRLVPLAPLSSFAVDAAGMRFSRIVLDEGRHPVQVRTSSRDGELVVVLPHTATPRDTLSLSITYTCHPRTGFFFVKPDRMYPGRPEQGWSQGEMEDNHYWFPCYDHPDDKATAEMHVTVDDKYTAISNGTLLSVTRNPSTGTHTFFWYSAKPFSSYLISLAVGRYERLDDSSNGIPVQYFVEPGQIADAPRSLSATPSIMKFYSDRIGFGYPWPKYAQTVVADFTYGGMENVSAATLTDRTIHSARAGLDVSSEGLIAHELAHQWFGDLVTCRDWADAWLNEGFATYFEALHTEATRGRDAFRTKMLGDQRSVVTSDTGTNRRPTVTNRYAEPEDLFDEHIYARGACILHMLRYLLGNDIFWNGIHHYVDLYRYDVASTDDFRRAMEDVSGRNLEWFFDEWTAKAGYPVFAVSTTYDSVARLLHLSIRQEQVVDSLTPLFRTPVDVAVTTAGGTATRRITVQPKPVQTVDIPCDDTPLNIVFDEGAWLLKSLHQKKPASMWLVQLRHGDAADRESALEELAADIADSSVAHAVGATLAGDPSEAVRKRAAEVLGEAHDHAVLPLLAPAFHDSVSAVRAAATMALGNFRTLDALVALGNIFESDSSYAVEAAAIESLAAIDSTHAMDYCRKGLSLDSHNEVIRAAAVRALGRIGTPEARRMILALTAYGQPRDVRTAAIETLATRWKHDAAVRQLVERLTQDRTHAVRRAALTALGTIGSTSSVPVLRRVIAGEPNGILKREARRALSHIESEEQ